MSIQLLDCTLRDGAYIVDGNFGDRAIYGIIKRLSEANIDIIECGWLKDSTYTSGSTYYHAPKDIEKFLGGIKKKNITYVAMIDWDRYDLRQLPDCNGKSIDAIRVVFPKGRCKEAVEIGRTIREKGYRIFLQAANTLGYTDYELLELAEEVNALKPEGLSVVDTFGAMYDTDIQRIVALLHNNLSSEISLGFHSHNNLQQSFSLSQGFIKLMDSTKRNIIIDASLSGMGRGAGNAPTELMAGFLNRFYDVNYDMDIIIDIIDVYMTYFKKHYEWGYSTSLFLAGTYCSHVNNITYLTQEHKTRNKDIKQILEALPKEKRLVYDYDLLEKTYVDQQQNEIDDCVTYELLSKELMGRTIVLVAPGKNAVEKREEIESAIKAENAIVIGINAVVPGYKYDYLFFTNFVRFEYALEADSKSFTNVPVLFTSNLMKSLEETACSTIKKHFLNYNTLIRRGWVHFDNSVIMCLRFLDILGISKVMMAGFDGFNSREDINYVSTVLELSSSNSDSLNSEISQMLEEFSRHKRMKIEFITPSRFEKSIL